MIGSWNNSLFSHLGSCGDSYDQYWVSNLQDLLHTGHPPTGVYFLGVSTSCFKNRRSVLDVMWNVFTILKTSSCLLSWALETFIAHRHTGHKKQTGPNATEISETSLETLLVSTPRCLTGSNSISPWTLTNSSSWRSSRQKANTRRYVQFVLPGFITNSRD